MTIALKTIEWRVFGPYASPTRARIRSLRRQGQGASVTPLALPDKPGNGTLEGRGVCRSGLGQSYMNLGAAEDVSDLVDECHEHRGCITKRRTRALRIPLGAAGRRVCIASKQQRASQCPKRGRLGAQDAAASTSPRAPQPEKST